MKAIHYVLILLFFILTASECEQVKLLSVEKLSLPGSGKYYHPRLDESGSRILLTSENYKGLLLYDTGTKELTSITDAESAGYSPVFLKDGKTILFTKQEFIRNLRFTGLSAYYSDTKVSEAVAPAVRTLTGPMVSGNQVLYKADGQLKSAQFGQTWPSSTTEITAGIENQQLFICINGQSWNISPYINESYIWPSVSPDGKRILAYAMGKGAFICDQEGKVLAELGKIEAPVWAGNDFIAGMITKDDGHQIISSEIVLVDLSSKEKMKISPDGVIAMYPSVAVKQQKLAFNTIEGDIYMVHYQLR